MQAALASVPAGMPHPLVLARELRRRPITQRLAGDARDAVLSLQSAAETFLRGLLRLLLVDRGESAAVIDSAARQAFESLLKTALPPLVGGDWVSPRAAETVYRRDLYDLRNRMTTLAWNRTGGGVPPAFDAYDELIRFIERQLLTRWTRPPRLSPDSGNHGRAGPSTSHLPLGHSFRSW